MLTNDDSDDSEPEIGMEALRPEALAALREVLATDRSENFGLSQFWYTADCADKIATALRQDASSQQQKIAVLSCPSVYDALLRRNPNDACILFEFDRKFKDAKNFVFFDFKSNPDKLFLNHETTLAHSFDIIIIDPPYVSKDCLEAFFDHCRFLAKNNITILAFTSVVNRTFLLEQREPEFRLMLTKCSLEFTTKLATPLRAFTNSRSLGLALEGFDAEEDDAASHLL